jgi:hypothetical protein
LDVKNNNWFRKRFRGDVPPRDFFSSASTSAFLIIFGGRNFEGVRLNDLHIWNFTLDQNDFYYCTVASDIVAIDERELLCLESAQIEL